MVLCKRHCPTVKPAVDNFRHSVHFFTTIRAVDCYCVNDVLDMNKLESGQIKLEEKPFSISEILKEVETVVGMAATEHGITLTVNKGEINHENLLGSSLHVRQILQNITSNAVKYNKPNGKVILECRELPPKNEKAVRKHITFVTLQFFWDSLLFFF